MTAEADSLGNPRRNDTIRLLVFIGGPVSRLCTPRRAGAERQLLRTRIRRTAAKDATLAPGPSTGPPGCRSTAVPPPRPPGDFCRTRNFPVECAGPQEVFCRGRSSRSELPDRQAGRTTAPRTLSDTWWPSPVGSHPRSIPPRAVEISLVSNVITNLDASGSRLWRPGAPPAVPKSPV